MAPYPISEFCFLLEGSVHLTTSDGELHIFRAGDAFFIEKGTVVEWKQVEEARKYYVIFSEDQTNKEQRSKL